MNMKVLIVALAVSAMVAAEPPRGRNPAPYPPSGWKPAGERLRLPARQTQPSPTYGPPPSSYGPPAQGYGPAEATTEVDFDTTTEPEAEINPIEEVGGRLKASQKQISRGQYYLLLEDGRLQRVVYVTEADRKMMGLTARLIYRDVQPVTGPIYDAARFRAPFLPNAQ